MILNNSFTVYPTNTFKRELSNIIHYIKDTLKAPIIADNLYENILQKISSLNFMPERYTKISDYKIKNKKLRKLIVNNYVVIYEVVHNTRSSFYFTYIS